MREEDKEREKTQTIQQNVSNQVKEEGFERKKSTNI